MKAAVVLVPIDIAACPLEVFSFVNEYANNGIAKVTLLHVSRLNVVQFENRLYSEVEEELERSLLRLQATFLSPQIDANVCVRAGKPAQEIAEQAAATTSDLIVLTSRSGRPRKGFFKADVVKQVIATAPCPVCVLRVGNRLNCQKPWSPTEKELIVANVAPVIVRPGWPPLVPV